MPLRKGKSDETARANTEEMIHSGYPPDQAYAAAKSQQRKAKRRHRKHGVGRAKARGGYGALHNRRRHGRK